MKIHRLAVLFSTGIGALAVTAEVEAMKAANQERQYRGESPAYDEDSFRQLADRLYGLSQDAGNIGR